MFKNLFSFSGRIRRTEYGITYLIYFVSSLTITFLSEMGGTAGMFFYLGYFPLLWLLAAQGAKRCHDRDNTGWYQIIPFYGFWMLFAEGDTGENRYGSDPKGFAGVQEFTI
jgi:uncharacterized membrane protein YhaH (DUF805 family)